MKANSSKFIASAEIRKLKFYEDKRKKRLRNFSVSKTIAKSGRLGDLITDFIIVLLKQRKRII